MRAKPGGTVNFEFVSQGLHSLAHLVQAGRGGFQIFRTFLILGAGVFNVQHGMG